MCAKILSSSNIDDINGWFVYTYLNDTLILKENNQLDKTDPVNILFNSILEKVKEGKMKGADIKNW